MQQQRRIVNLRYNQRMSILGNGKPTIVIFLGQIGAGKSFFARQLAENTGAVRLSSDAIRTAWTGIKDPIIEKDDVEKGKTVQSIARTMNYATTQIIQSGHDVICDSARFNHQAYRRELYNLAKQLGAEVVIVWIMTPREVSSQRAQTRESLDDQRVFSPEQTEQILDKHYENFDEPTEDELYMQIDGTITFERQYDLFCQKIKEFL